MDETIRIYNPGKQLNNRIYSARPVVASYSESESVKEKSTKKNAKTDARASKKNSKWKSLLDPEPWKEVVNARSKRTNELAERFPVHVIGYRWFTALVVILLFVSFGVWGIQIHTERTAVAYAETVAAEKDAAHQAYIDQQKADEEAAAKSLERLMMTNATVKAKLAYGSRNFIEKYNYSDADFMTLYQCIDNRLQNRMYEGQSIDEIAFREGQFIASYSTNPVEDYYYNLAMKSERANINRASQPVSTDYVYAVYTPHGIYLTSDPKAPEYTWWHYSE